MSVRKSRDLHSEPDRTFAPQASSGTILWQACRRLEGRQFGEARQVCSHLNEIFLKTSGSQKAVWNSIDLINATRHGFPKKTLKILARALEINKVVELDEILKISKRSLQRYEAKKETELLSKDLSDHIMQVFKVYMRAIDVFEDQDNALRWLKSPIPALGQRVPLKLLDTSAGVDLVMAELGRIEYGVFA